MSDRDIDDVTGVETTGHEWDGIKELNNPLPRWWLWTFYACIVFAIGYSVVFPAWPLISSATPGLLGYSSRADHAAEVATAKAAQGDTLARIAATPVAEILDHAGLARFAASGGRSLFKVYCSQCHGTGATGAVGYPNLNDDEWIWGGTIDEIYATISHGARSQSDADTHYNLMPSFGDGILERPQIDAVARYVASLTGIEGGETTEEGQLLFADNCAGCHGDQGQGLKEAGGPSLDDGIWLYEGSLDAIAAQIERPRHGVMPAWMPRLGDVSVKQLAVYVHGLEVASKGGPSPIGSGRVPLRPGALLASRGVPERPGRIPLRRLIWIKGSKSSSWHKSGIAPRDRHACRSSQLPDS